VSTFLKEVTIEYQGDCCDPKCPCFAVDNDRAFCGVCGALERANFEDSFFRGTECLERAEGLDELS
jgi:hypothetical protein